MSKNWLNGAMLMAIAAFSALHATQRTPTRVLASNGHDDELAKLEAAVALSPGNPNVVQPLVQAYLDQSQPGMAVAVLERAPRAAYATPELGELASAAYLSVGRSEDALAVTRNLINTCSNESAHCNATFMVRNIRRERLLTAIVDMGIKDPMQNPEAVTMAYQQTVRQVRVAMLQFSNHIIAVLRH